MTARSSSASLVRRRLRAHGLARPLADTPQEVVRRLGAMQAENYPLAKWSIGQRAAAVLTDRSLELALADGTILRTHLLRPTWHFVLPRDIRWIQGLTAPRVRAMSASRYRDLELDARLLSRSHEIIARALEGGHHHTRGELGERLVEAGVDARVDRLAHIVMDAELECLICSGSPRGKSQTYALLDERAPGGDRLEGEAALAELARRYFTTRGPATEIDFRWWSSLKAVDARRALEAARPSLGQVELDGRTYWLGPDGSGPASGRSPSIQLIQRLDEYVVAYTRSRELVLDGALKRRNVLGEGRHLHPMLRRGRVVGLWQRRVNGAALEILTESSRLERADRHSLERAAARYGRFFGVPVELTHMSSLE